jgi:hypothetical protein
MNMDLEIAVRGREFQRCDTANILSADILLWNHETLDAVRSDGPPARIGMFGGQWFKRWDVIGGHVAESDLRMP